MSGAVTVPSLTMMTSVVSEESLARDTHTLLTTQHTHNHNTHTHTHTEQTPTHTENTHRPWVIYVNIFKVAYDFENKKVNIFSQVSCWQLLLVVAVWQTWDWWSMRCLVVQQSLLEQKSPTLRATILATLEQSEWWLVRPGIKEVSASFMHKLFMKWCGGVTVNFHLYSPYFQKEAHGAFFVLFFVWQFNLVYHICSIFCVIIAPALSLLFFLQQMDMCTNLGAYHTHEVCTRVDFEGQKNCPSPCSTRGSNPGSLD